jgi:hypothetical protein
MDVLFIYRVDSQRKLPLPVSSHMKEIHNGTALA